MFATSDSVEVTGVITFRGGAIMVGAAGPEGQREAAVWLSPDGRNWTPSESPELGGPENQVIKAIVPFHGRLIAVGVDHSGNGANAGAWVGTPITASSPPPSPSPSPSPSQAPSQTPELAGCSTSR
jgi:hypothetical protein